MNKLTRKELVAAYGQWLKHFDWKLFGTLTFPEDSSRSSADRKFRKFLESIEKEYGTDDFGFFKVAETGAVSGQLHFHILVCGLEGDLRYVGPKLTRRWFDFARGASAFGEFDQEKGGIFYLLKGLMPDVDFDCEVQLPDRAPGRK